MAEAKIADTKPCVLELDPGTYYWCSCGLSDKQPFCSGAHKGTGLTPVKIEVTEQKKLALCMCKRTGGAPTCDGSHRTL